MPSFASSGPKPLVEMGGGRGAANREAEAWILLFFPFSHLCSLLACSHVLPEVGSFLHECEGEAVCKLTNEKASSFFILSTRGGRTFLVWETGFTGTMSCINLFVPGFLLAGALL